MYPSFANTHGQHEIEYNINKNLRNGGQQRPAAQTHQAGSIGSVHGTEHPGYGYTSQLPLETTTVRPVTMHGASPQFIPNPHAAHLGRLSQDLITRPPSGASNHTSQTNGTFRTQRAPFGAPVAPRSRKFLPLNKLSDDRRSTFHDEDDGDFEIGGYNERSGHRVDSIAEFTRPALSGSGPAISQALTRTSSETLRGPTRQTPYTLAQAIKNGDTEDPSEEVQLHRKYTTPMKLAMPGFGPTRFRGSKMFSSIDALRPPPFAGAPAQETTQLVRSGLPRVDKVANPLWLSPVQQGLCIPTMEELLHDLPVTDLARMVSASTAGVIKIREIPYATPRAHMIAFLGRNAQILRQPEASPFHAVHILMERESGKTGDCYVEVASPAEAAFVVRAFKKRIQAGRPPKVGDRTVEVVFSSQDELLAELFPRAKHVHWRDGEPIVDRTPRAYYEGERAVGFQGFIHPEEFIMLLKHAEAKDRSPFASKSPTRIYESLITIMHKYPWYAPKYIPIHERDRIYDCVLQLMSNLVQAINASNGNFGPSDLSPPLLQEMVTAALVCPGFSEAQKAKIVGYMEQDGFGAMVRGAGSNVQLGGTHPLACYWPFTAVSVTPGVDMELVKYYGYLFHQATVPGAAILHPMGDITINYKGSADPSRLSLAVAAKIEYAKIEELLEKVIDTEPDRQQTPSPLLNSRTTTPTPESARLGWSMTHADESQNGHNGSHQNGQGYSMTAAYGMPQSSGSTRGSNGSQGSQGSVHTIRPIARPIPPAPSNKSDPTATENRGTVGRVVRSNFTW